MSGNSHLVSIFSSSALTHYMRNMQQQCIAHSPKRRSVQCREASQDQQLQSPQQYGIWQVDGLGLVVAFRGTSSWDDVFVDINVRPTPLTHDPGNINLQYHKQSPCCSCLKPSQLEDVQRCSALRASLYHHTLRAYVRLAICFGLQCQ